MREIVVIGGGAGGLAAAIVAKEEGKDVLLIEREETLGGILNQCIHNGFGLEVFKEEYTGPEYAYQYIKKIKDLNIDYILDTTVTGIDKNEDIFTISMTSKSQGITTLEAKAVILTSGCYERTRGQITMPGDRPRGVFTAGSAQRYLNIDGYLVGKKVFILGSGDIGLIMARRMTLEGAKVLGVAEIMPYSNGLNRNIVQCLNDFSIPLYLSHTVTKTIADENNNLEKIIIQKVDETFKPVEGTEKVFEVDALLLSIGLIPDITILDNLKIDTDSKTKSAIVNQAYETSVPGLFISGNALQVHDLVDNVTKESQRAAMNAVKYLEKKQDLGKKIRLIAGKNIGYVTPQIIDFSWKKANLILSFRTTKKIEKAILKVFQNNSVIYEKRMVFLVPAEMETISFDYLNLNQEEGLYIELEELS
jgi:NADPH-dependent 2,4-dienoyl-CoA reductase/sulfur reductase-like enzyme